MGEEGEKMFVKSLKNKFMNTSSRQRRIINKLNNVIEGMDKKDKERQEKILSLGKGKNKR